MKYDFYICCSHNDRMIADPLYKGLTARGYTVFYDLESLIVGDDCLDQISNAIAECDCFIPIMTEKTMSSVFVKHEIDYAISCSKGRDKKIIPIVERSFDLSSAFEINIGRYQCFKFSSSLDISDIVERIDGICRFDIKKSKLYAKFAEFTQLGYGYIKQKTSVTCELIQLICDSYDGKRETCRELFRLYTSLTNYRGDADTEPVKTAHIILDALDRFQDLADGDKSFLRDLYSSAFAIRMLALDHDEIRNECVYIITHGDVNLPYPSKFAYGKQKRFVAAFLDDSGNFEKYVETCTEDDIAFIKETFKILNELSYASYIFEGDDEMLEHCEKVFKQAYLILGYKDTDTLKAIEYLSAAYSQVGDYEKALEVQKSAYAPFLDLTCGEISTDSYDQQCYTAFSPSQKILNEDKPAAMLAFHNLAVACANMHDYTTSVSLLEKVYNFRRKKLGEEHPDTLITLNNLAYVYSQLGYIQKALKLREKCRKLFAKVYGIDHTYTKEAAQRLIYNYSDFYTHPTSKTRKPNKPVETPVMTEEDEILLSIAGFMQDGNKLFDALRQKGLAGGDFLKCLQTSYERLKKYCEVVGAKDVVSECIDRIDEIRSMIERKPEDAASSEKAENGIKSLLGFTTLGSGGYDLFISFKDEDRDLAENIYNYCHEYMKVPFFSKRSLPELSASEYANEIYRALDKSKHFVVVFSKLEYLDAGWVSEEMRVFHDEIVEKRKKDAKFILIVTDDVYDSIIKSNKKCLEIRYRSYEIMKMSEYKSKLHKYLV